ncbi:Gfo/Idh/MocA family protein [Plantactinospora sp. DSM 117369]
MIGCADIAWRRMLPAMAAASRIRVTAIGSRDVTRATRFTQRYGGVPVAGYQAVLERDDVDAVYIPLPSMLHAEWIERALLAHKHVLVEKPLTAQPARTDELVDLARSRELTLVENSSFLLHSQHRLVRRMLDEQAIGTLREFSCAFTIPPRPDTDNRYQLAVGGGALVDLGGYPVRAALHFLGPELEVCGAVLRQERRRGVIISGAALMTTPEGVTARLTFGMEHSYRSGYELAGSLGRLSVDRVFTPPPTYQPVIRIERQDHREEFLLPGDDQTDNMLTAFASAVLDGTDLTDAAEGSRRQAELVQQLQAQARLVTF